MGGDHAFAGSAEFFLHTSSSARLVLGKNQGDERVSAAPESANPDTASASYQVHFWTVANRLSRCCLFRSCRAGKCRLPPMHQRQDVVATWLVVQAE